MNTVREILSINEQELSLGLAGTPASWHTKYAQAAWVYVGNLDVSLTEGDVVCVLSQYGEVEDLHLVRHDDTGASRGFCFGKYEDARSCVLAVDNLCGITLCGRTLRVDHVENYRLPKNLADQQQQDETKQAAHNQGATTTTTTTNDGDTPDGLTGRVYQGSELASHYTLQRGQDLFAPPPAAKGATGGGATAPPRSTDSKRRLSGDERDESESSWKRHKHDRQEPRRFAKEQRKRERDVIRMEREERRRIRRAQKQPTTKLPVVRDT